MNRDEAIARIRAEVAAGLDPGAMLSAYSDPSRRRAIHERVRHASAVDLSDDEVASIAAELFGFGVLQPLLDDPDVNDVLVNAADEVYVDRGGELKRVDVRFDGAPQVAELAHRIAAGVGRELTLERPYVDARMRDGSRANVVIAPIGGPTISIRKFSRLSIPLRGPAPSWTANGAITEEAADLLEQAVASRGNVLIAGPTAAGKSTLLRSLAGTIPANERIVVIEDTNELALPHPQVVRLEAQAGRESPIGTADLVANALRMRPDRIIVGEVRTPREAVALLDALTSGHDGSMTTIHAASARGALDRLELLLMRAGDAAPGALHRHVLSAFDVIVHLARSSRGRVVDEIAVLDEGVLRHAHAPERAWSLPARLRRRIA